MSRWIALAALALMTGACSPDADGDGIKEKDDCDDADASAYPGATEVCDGVDNNCDGTIDEPDATDAITWYADGDDDGHGVTDSTVACDQPAGYAATSDDCDDADSATHPGATEVCDDGVDNKCETDGQFDCDDLDCTGDAVCAPTLTTIDPTSGRRDLAHRVSLTGSGFDFLSAGTTTVSFAGVGDCTSLTVVDANSLNCLTPIASTSQTTDVTVSNDNGSATLTDAYTFTSVLFVADGKSGTTGSLYAVDMTDFTVTEVGKIVDGAGTGYGLTGLTFGSDGKLYGASSSQNNTSYFLEIDPETGRATVIGPIETADGTTHGSTPDITSVGARIVGWTESGDDPMEIDPTTGQLTVLGNGTGSYGSAMAANTAGTIWLMPQGKDGEVFTVDASTGAVTTAGFSLSGGSGDNTYVANSATFHDGRLYAVEADFNSDGLSYLTSVDTTTGVMTSHGRLPGAIDAIASPTP